MFAFPGLSARSSAFVAELEALSKRLGLDANGIGAVIQAESGFDPEARNPKSGASGLIQFMPRTALSLGTTIDAIREMSAEQQLPWVEKFFRKATTRIPQRLEDYWLIVLGRPDLIGTSDGTVVFPASTDPKSAYQQNIVLDKSGKGYVSVGDVRGILRGVISRAKSDGMVISVPSVITKPKVFLTVVGAALLAAATGYTVFQIRKQ